MECNVLNRKHEEDWARQSEKLENFLAYEVFWHRIDLHASEFARAAVNFRNKTVKFTVSR